MMKRAISLLSIAIVLIIAGCAGPKSIKYNETGQVVEMPTMAYIVEKSKENYGECMIQVKTAALASAPMAPPTTSAGEAAYWRAEEMKHLMAGIIAVGGKESIHPCMQGLVAAVGAEQAIQIAREQTTQRWIRGGTTVLGITAAAWGFSEVAAAMAGAGGIQIKDSTLTSTANTGGGGGVSNTGIPGEPTPLPTPEPTAEPGTELAGTFGGAGAPSGSANSAIILNTGKGATNGLDLSGASFGNTSSGGDMNEEARSGLFGQF